MNQLTGKNIATAACKTILVIAIVIGILILDVWIIREAYFGLKFVGNEISEAVEAFAEWVPETEAKGEAAPETEKRSSEEILKEENEKLDRIMAAQEAAKGE